MGIANPLLVPSTPPLAGAAASTGMAPSLGSYSKDATPENSSAGTHGAFGIRAPPFVAGVTVPHLSKSLPQSPGMGTPYKSEPFPGLLFWTQKALWSASLRRVFWRADPVNGPRSVTHTMYEAMSVYPLLSVIPLTCLSIITGAREYQFSSDPAIILFDDRFSTATNVFLEYSPVDEIVHSLKALPLGVILLTGGPLPHFGGASRTVVHTNSGDSVAFALRRFSFTKRAFDSITHAIVRQTYSLVSCMLTVVQGSVIHSEERIIAVLAWNEVWELP